MPEPESIEALIREKWAEVKEVAPDRTHEPGFVLSIVGGLTESWSETLDRIPTELQEAANQDYLNAIYAALALYEVDRLHKELE